jgi:hypothetical protein
MGLSDYIWKYLYNHEDMERSLSKKIKRLCDSYFTHMSLIEKGKLETNDTHHNQKGISFVHFPRKEMDHILNELSDHHWMMNDDVKRSVEKILTLRHALRERGATQKVALEQVRPEFEKLNSAIRYTKPS